MYGSVSSAESNKGHRGDNHDLERGRLHGTRTPPIDTMEETNHIRHHIHCPVHEYSPIVGAGLSRAYRSVDADACGTQRRSNSLEWMPNKRHSLDWTPDSGRKRLQD
eukprot:2721390-Ditylum_brightwellii.AAC.1